MKSLEKINYLIAEMETTGEFANCTYISKNDCKQIKQDLEVLEVLKKYLYYIDHTIKLKPINKSVYNFDYEKIKQWLEVNEG